MGLLGLASVGVILLGMIVAAMPYRGYEAMRIRRSTTSSRNSAR